MGLVRRIALRTMNIAVMAIGGLFLSGAVSADELQPMQGGIVQLGPVSGSFYYTDGPDGYRVVTTLSQLPNEAPVRFISTLRNGESVIVSVPRAAGQPAAELRIHRVGDHLIYDRNTPATASID